MKLRCPACRAIHASNASPQISCSCGATLRVPRSADRIVRAELHAGVLAAMQAFGDDFAKARSDNKSETFAVHLSEKLSRWQLPNLTLPQRANQPLTPIQIRSARHAEANACAYLQRLGFAKAAMTSAGADGGVDVLGPGIVAQVKAEAKPVGAPVVQQLFGCAAAEEAQAAFFALCGYTDQARAFADKARVALYTFDLTGSCTPINTHAENFSAPAGVQDAAVLVWDPAGLAPWTLCGDVGPNGWQQLLAELVHRGGERSPVIRVDMPGPPNAAGMAVSIGHAADIRSFIGIGGRQLSSRAHLAAALVADPGVVILDPEAWEQAPSTIRWSLVNAIMTRTLVTGDPEEPQIVRLPRHIYVLPQSMLAPSADLVVALPDGSAAWDALLVSSIAHVELRGSREQRAEMYALIDETKRQAASRR